MLVVRSAAMFMSQFVSCQLVNKPQNNAGYTILYHCEVAQHPSLNPQMHKWVKNTLSQVFFWQCFQKEELQLFHVPGIPQKHIDNIIQFKIVSILLYILQKIQICIYIPPSLSQKRHAFTYLMRTSDFYQLQLSEIYFMRIHTYSIYTSVTYHKKYLTQYLIDVSIISYQFYSQIPKLALYAFCVCIVCVHCELLHHMTARLDSYTQKNCILTSVI